MYFRFHAKKIDILLKIKVFCMCSQRDKRYNLHFLKKGKEWDKWDKSRVS